MKEKIDLSFINSVSAPIFPGGIGFSCKAGENTHSAKVFISHSSLIGRWQINETSIKKCLEEGRKWGILLQTCHRFEKEVTNLPHFLPHPDSNRFSATLQQTKFVQILRYSRQRWQIETAFLYVKQHFGLDTYPLTSRRSIKRMKKI